MVSMLTFGVSDDPGLVRRTTKLLFGDEFVSNPAPVLLHDKPGLHQEYTSTCQIIARLAALADLYLASRNSSLRGDVRNAVRVALTDRLAVLVRYWLTVCRDHFSLGLRSEAIASGVSLGMGADKGTMPVPPETLLEYSEDAVQVIPFSSKPGQSWLKEQFKESCLCLNLPTCTPTTSTCSSADH